MRQTSTLLFALAIVFSTGARVQQASYSLSHDTAYSAPAGKRVALVIGNSAYKKLPRLKNPTNDANDMERALKELGFDVTLKIDIATKDEMLKLIGEWSRKIPVSGVALFYFAGHGGQVEGSNYLFPIAMEWPRTGKVKDEVEREAIDLASLLVMMTTPDHHVNVVIIDACRNDLRRVSPELGPGLAAVIGSRGTYIAYATAPGSYASDGTGKNGLFTEHLLKHIRTPKLKIEDLFRRVRAEVTSDEANRIGQLPWDASSMLVDFYFEPENEPGEPGHSSTESSPVRITTIPAYNPIGGHPPSEKIEGEILGVDTKGLHLVLYSWTDKWYVQPTQDNPFTQIGQDGKWSARIHGGTRYAAVLVKPDFKPQSVAFNLPNIGEEVVAITTVIGQRK